jgi:predicted nucleic acid-binding protein
MKPHFIDTNIIIRFLTGDDPGKQAACAQLFQRVEKGERKVFVPDLILAECVYVLASPRLYNLTRDKIVSLLAPIVSLKHVEVQNRTTLSNALTLYATTRLDFADAYILATMEQKKTNHLISYDSDFDDFPFITREEPTPAKKAA